MGIGRPADKPGCTNWLPCGNTVLREVLRMSHAKKTNGNSLLNKRGDIAASISRLSDGIEAGRGRSSTISLFEAAVLIAKRLPQKAQTDTDDLFDLGAQQLLSKLQSGEVQATGINVQSRLRETITYQHWECATYDISGYEPNLQHYVDFLDMHRPDEGGFGGSLTLAGTTKPAWIYITVPASLVSDIPTPRASMTRRGAKPRYDWPAFDAELLRLIEYEGAPSVSVDSNWRQKHVEVRMAEWCTSKWGTEPSESTIRSKVSRYLASL